GVPRPGWGVVAAPGRGAHAGPRSAAEAVSMPGAIDREELLRRYDRRLELLVPAEASVLKPLPLFAGIPEKARDKVIEKVRKYLHLVRYDAGEIVLREGDYGDSAYYIVDGAVEVVLGALPGAGQEGTRAKVRSGAHVPPAQRAG